MTKNLIIAALIACVYRHRVCIERRVATLGAGAWRRQCSGSQPGRVA